MKKQSDAFWKSHVTKFYQSSLSQNEYCRRNQLKVSSFSVQKYRFAEQVSPKTKSDFVAMASSSVSEQKSIVITLSSGITLKFDNEPSSKWLGEVLGAISDHTASSI